MNSNKLSGPAGIERNLAKTVLDMEIFVSTFINDPPAQISTVTALIEDKMKLEVEGLIDSKLRTAVQFAKGIARDEGGKSLFKSVLESKASQQIGLVVGAKQYRQRNTKLTDALDQIRPHSPTSIDYVEELTEDEIHKASRQDTCDSRRDVIITLVVNKGGGSQDIAETLRTLNTNMWAILSAKA